MKKMKYLSAIVLCAAFFCGGQNVSAQSKTEIDGMIEFFEWVLKPTSRPPNVHRWKNL